MATESRFDEMITKANAWVIEQEWFQEGRAKWEEVDPEMRGIITKIGVLLGLILMIGTGYSTMSGVWEKEKKFDKRQELLTLIQNAGDKLEFLKSQQSSMPQSAPTAVISIVDIVKSEASKNNIDPGKLKIDPPKPGKSDDTLKESLGDIRLTKVNIKQVMRLANGLESGNNFIKIRYIGIDTVGADGYLNAYIALSKFHKVSN